MGLFRKKKKDKVISCEFNSFFNFLPNIEDGYIVKAYVLDEGLTIKTNVPFYKREVVLPYRKIKAIQKGDAVVAYEKSNGGDFLGGMAGAAIAGLPGAILANSATAQTVTKTKTIPVLLITYRGDSGEDAYICMKIVSYSRSKQEFIDAICEKVGIEESPYLSSRKQEDESRIVL